MKKFIFLVNACCCFFITHAQSPKDCSVELWATVQSSPPQITLNWLSSATTTNYAIGRKPKASNAWTTIVPTLAGGATQYVDNTVSPGVEYEYGVVRSGTNY